MKVKGAGGARFVRRAVSFLVDYLVMVAWMAVGRTPYDRISGTVVDDRRDRR